MKHLGKIFLATACCALLCLLPGCGDPAPLPETTETVHIHRFGQWKILEDADCTREGLQERSCHCGEKEQQAIAPLGHVPMADPGTIPTCTTDGLTEGEHCAACNAVLVEQKKIPAVGHKEVAIPAKAATCTAVGWTEGVRCGVCHAVLVTRRQTPIKSHEFGDYVDDHNATCTQDGTETAQCTHCGAERTRPIPGTAGEHEFRDYASDGNATCMADGTRTGHCKHCGTSDTRVEEGSQKAHVFEQYTTHTKETCTANRTEISQCENCDALNVRPVANTARGHSPVTDPAGTASCTEYGLSEGSHCSACGGVLVKQVLFPAKGHTLSGEECACGDSHRSQGLIFVLNKEENGYILTGLGTCTDTVLVIPETHQDLPVTAIGERAFFECDRLTNVIIPGGVTVIGQEAFARCMGLKSVTISAGVTQIGASAFEACTNLRSVAVPESVERIGAGAFFYCTELDSVFVENIAQWCTIDFDGVGANPLSNSDLYLDGAIVTRLTIQQGVATIADYAFSGCRSLEKITVTDSTQIGKYAFSWCFDLAAVQLGSSVQHIGEGAFLGCGGLTRVEMPSTILTVGQDALRWCEKLAVIIYAGTREQWELVEQGENWDDGTGTYRLFQGEPTLALKKTEITLSPTNGLSYDLYQLLVDKELFDKTMLVCQSGDETVLQLELTKVTALANSPGGVYVTIRYGGQSVQCLVRVTAMEQ